MDIKIDKNIPIPPINHGDNTRNKYPWKEMEIGDSIFIPGKRQNVSEYCSRLGIIITTRQLVENGVLGLRVWRIA